MAYMDLVYEICAYLNDSERGFNSWVCEDGDNEGEEVLVIYDTQELATLNSRLKEKFEELGVDTSDVFRTDDDESYVEFATDGKWEYYDEVYTCDGCGKVFRIEQYGYRNYYMGDGYILCPECLKEDPSEYIEGLINNPKNANTLFSAEELNDLGFERVGEEYENGWYGQTDDPKTILDNILAENPNAEVIFDIVKDYNPFATRFITYIRTDKEEE